MALVKDRVMETTTSTGTGTINLAGAKTGYRAFSDAFTTGDSVYYAIVGGAEWEVGTGTVTTGSPWTLSRTPVSSSNANALVSFAAGTKDVYCTITADVAMQSATQTLTNKTLDAPTIINGYTEEVATANTSTAYTIDLANGSVQILTLTGNCTYTFPTPTAGKSFTLMQKQDGTGSRTVTWPSSVKWPASTSPTLTSTASKGDKLVFTADGTYWWGSVAGLNYL
jgi:hypothetical protein